MLPWVACASQERRDPISHAITYLHVDNDSELNQLAEYPNLKHVVINGSQFTSVPTVLSELGKLEDVEFYRTEEMDWNQCFSVLTKCKSLKSITLKDIKGMRVPNSLGEIRGLTSLFIDRLDTVIIDVDVKDLRKFKTLSLIRVNYFLLPLGLNMQENFSTLRLNECNLIALPAEVLNCPNMSNIDLSNNPDIDLDVVSTQLAKFSKLRKLAVANCGIVELPDSFERLSYLESLSLASNRLARLPFYISEWQSLIFLDISDNDFRSFPYETLGLKMLKILDLSSNAIEDVLCAEVKSNESVFWVGVANCPIRQDDERCLQALYPNATLHRE